MPESFDGPGGEDAALSRAYAAEAREHLARRAIDQAVRCIFEAVDHDPTNTALMREFVHALQDVDRHQDALSLVHRILAIEPDNTAAHIDLGFSLEPLGEIERAYAAYTRASELDPGDATGLNNRAFLELSRGNLEAALSDVEAAIARDLTEGIAHATHAEVLAQLGRIDEAFSALTSAVKISAEWIHTAKESEFLDELRAHPRWDRWLAENEPALGDA